MKNKALVVDNDFFFVEFLCELLNKRGYQVLKAYNGKEAIAKLEDEVVDILFADLILPKIDGRQFFKFLREKYEQRPFPIIALSGTMIEQLGSLHEIGADYFIAKGPIDQLTIKINEFMAEIDTNATLRPSDNKVLATGNVFPRRDAMELMDALHFHQAVIESAAVGIVIVDDDSRILNANPAALEIIGTRSVDVLNRPVTDLFSAEERSELVNGLKLVRRQRELKKYSFFATYRSGVISASVSSIHIKDDSVGWVVALEPSGQVSCQTSLN